MSEPERMTHLHVHSDMSQLDGCAKMADYIKMAKERGHKAIAFTEHGTMRGFYQLLLDSKEHDIKPIYGVELYVCSDMTRKGLTPEEKAAVIGDKKLNKKEQKELLREHENLLGIRGSWHMTAWAKNMTGLKNLFKITSKAWIEGFYYKPRVDLKLLIEHGDGIIVGTACCGGMLGELAWKGRDKQAMEAADALYERFGDDFWLEIMPHDLPEQVKTNQFMIECQKRWGRKGRLLATQDAHYLHEGDWEHHEVLLAIGTNSVMSNPDRFRFTDKGFHFRTRQEMLEAFKKYHSYINESMVNSALDKTVVLADGVDCQVEIDRFKCLAPAPYIPTEYNGDEYRYMLELCKKGWAWRDIRGRAKRLAAKENVSPMVIETRYIERLKMELTAIKKQKFIDYFLIVHELYKWIREQNIACGPGRGSAAGSIVSFLLGITSVDPIEHKLLFERFINPNRVDMPDIDMDFEDVRRQEIIEHLREKYGSDKVCQIATIGKLSGKQCLKDVSRVLEVPFLEVNQVTNSIIERSSGDERASMTIEDSFKEFKVCREFNQKYPKVLHHAKRLEGLAKNLGIHAAGVVTSPVPLTELVPLETRDHSSGNPIVVCAVDMYGAAAMGLLKLDVLGLRTMTVLREAVEAIKRRHGVEVDLERLDLDDPHVLQGFTDHEYIGIFQYDSPGADKICSGVEFVNFEDVAAMTALNRPGTARSGLATQYVARKKNPELIKKTAFHPKVSEITSDTLGIIVYQEHVIKIFTDIAGFAPGTADSRRKKIAKKWGDETIGKERENFIKGACDKTEGMTPEIAGKLMDAITFFGSYGFNKSHATAYGMIAYWGMWLKIKYPLEFYWALLKNEPNRIRIQQVAKDAKRHGVEIANPDVNVSRIGFSIDDSKGIIRGSMVDIKNVGETAATSIMEQQPFKDFCDFLERVNRRKVNKRVVASLARAGALDNLIPNVRWFIENLDEVWKVVGKAKFRKGVEELLEKSKSEPQWSDEEKQLIASKVSPLAFGQHPVDAYGDFISRSIKVPIANMSDENFFKDHNGKGCFILGVVVEVKYNQVGDFHTGALPDEDERTRMGWGKRYANVNVEDAGGKQNRIKVDWDIFDDYREIVDAGVGTPVVLHAIANARYENLRAQFIIDLEEYRQKIENGKELSIWERILSGQHPVLTRQWKSKASRRAAMIPYGDTIKQAGAIYKDKGEATFNITGVITHVKEKYDKKMNLMAFFGVIGVEGYADVLCFASSWSDFSHHIKPGRLLTLKLSRERGANFLHSDTGKIWILDSSKVPKDT